MNGTELFERIKQSSTFDELLQSIKEKTSAETQSKRGNVFEKVCDSIIKFGCCTILPNDTYEHYEGNINTCKIKKVDNLETYLHKMSVFSKGKGGSSDITLQHKLTEKWVFISSKFYLDDSKKSIDKYDVEKILAVTQQHAHKYKEFDIYLLVNNKQKLLETITASHSTNNYIKDNIHHILDLSDLEPYFQNLRSAIQFVPIEEYNARFSNPKIPLELRFHQDFITSLMMVRIGEGEKELLLGAKARSGKTYCVGGLFIKYYKKYASLNALIITPAPTETLSQFTNDLFHKFRDFIGINIIEIEKGSDFDTLVLQENNIIIVSKQLLDDYVFEKKVAAIVALGLDFIVFDENHFHGTTQMSKDILEAYSSPKTTKVFLTATYAKPLNEWSIPTNCQFYWDIEDEQLCKKRNIQGLVEKHGEDVLTFLTEENKEQQLAVYDKMPDLQLITNIMNIDSFQNIKERIKDTSYGFSHATLLSTTSLRKEKLTNTKGETKMTVVGGGDNFNYTEEVDILLKRISGDGTVDEQACVVRDKMSIFERIKTISQNSGSRTNLNNGDFTSQLWFLPFGQDMLIDNVSECLKKRMLKNRVLRKYEIMIVNSKRDYKDLKEEIKNTELKAKDDGKNGLILLAGNQLTLGITLPFVDIVFLMNDIVSSDKIVQMMYRCMTESIRNAENDKINSGVKKMGFVVDFNISRVLNTLLDYNVHKKDLNVEQKFTYLVENNLINIDSDLFESRENKTKLVEKLLQIWKGNPINNLRSLLKKIEDVIIDLDTADQRIVNHHFTSSTGDEKVKVNVHVNFDDESDEALASGKEMVKKSVSEGDDDEDKEGEGEGEIDGEQDDADVDTDIKSDISLTKDVLPFVIPLSCILTMNTENKDILEMLNVIKTTPTLLDVFNDQSFIWWNKKDIIKLIEKIVEKYIKKNSSIYNIAIQFKMSLQSLIDKPKELLEIIDSCLKPKEIEKKKFGEVFTPMSFINMNMLGDLEAYYREKYSKNIFEDETLKWGDTTAGMGNFPIAIYYKLMDGLKQKIPNDKNRKKHILENMLFMAELNKKNCFIIRQIFDINNEYKLNLYEGDSLQLDIQKVFEIDRLDIIIGNPPYNDEFKGKNGYAPAVYNKFTEFYIGKCDIMCFVIPSRWFSGGRGLDKFRKMMLSRKDIPYIKHFDDASKIFGSTIDIKGGVNYFLKDIGYDGPCCYNSVMLNLNDCDILIESKYLPLINKMGAFPKLNTSYRSKGYFEIPLTDKRLHDTRDVDVDIKCYVSQMKGFNKYINKNSVNDTKLGKWQIITPSAAHGAFSGFGNLIIGTPTDVYSETYISFELDTETEANSLLSYMKCRLPNMLLSLRKISQNISNDTCKWIPLPPLNKKWNDSEVYKYFQLTEDDIRLINDTHIGGYTSIIQEPDNIESVTTEVEVEAEVEAKAKVEAEVEAVKVDVNVEKIKRKKIGKKKQAVILEEVV